MLVLVVLLTAAGCGGDEDPRGTTPAGAGTTGETAARDGPEGASSSLGKGPASPRDADAQRGLKRDLQQRGIGGAKRIVVRGSDVTIRTGFGQRRRDAAASLCLGARRFFLRQGQGQVQTLYDIVVEGRGGILARC